LNKQIEIKIKYFGKLTVIDLSIIIVNFNTCELLKNCLDSVYLHTKDLNFEIIVVDNASSDNSLLTVKEKFPHVKLIENSKNVGFARANNQGIEISTGKYILLLNSDTLLINNVLPNLVALLEKKQNFGIVGPQVLNEDKSLQFSFGNFPGIQAELERTFLLENRLTRKRMLNDKRIFAQDAFPVNWVSGCCLMIRRNVYEKIGGLDEQFFLFNEEADWCLRALKAGWPTCYDPGSQIIHYGGKSTQKNYYTFVLSRYHSRLLFIKKHYSPLVQFLFRCIVVFALYIRIILTLFTFFNAKERKQRNSAYKYALLLHLGLKQKVAF